jgi:hypothetical protein
MPAPTWWYHDSIISTDPPETRRCSSMWNAKAPIVIVPRVSAETATALTRGDQ